MLLKSVLLLCLCATVALAAVPRPRNFKDLLRQKREAKDDDPDLYKDVYQLITTKGYPCEEYQVTTDDGYILSVQRIPYGKNAPGNAQTKNKPVVYLQHGLLDSATTWVINFDNESLGFMLADAGYEVWLGNMRGNTYGMAHTTLSTKDDKFWEFTFDDMAQHDLVAIVEYALKVSGQDSLYYVGHSQGTLIGFIQYSQDPTWAQSKIRQFHALAPIAWLGHSTSPLMLIAPYSNDIGFWLELFGVDEFLPSNDFMIWLGGSLCQGDTAWMCTNVLILFVGYDTPNMNNTRLDVYTTHAPSGTSTYNIVHFGQLMSTGKFQAMDWGYFNNPDHYGKGQHDPPQYHPQTMTVPTALYWGDIDCFADPTDVSYLQQFIQNLLGSYRYKDMDHLDFVWGMNAPTEPYPQLMKLIADDVAARAKK